MAEKLNFVQQTSGLENKGPLDKWANRKVDQQSSRPLTWWTSKIL